MGYRWKLTIITVLCWFFVSGCWGRKFFRAPGETIETSTKVDSLLKENMILQRRVYNLEQMMLRQQEYSRGQNAQAKLDLEEIKDRINALNQAIEESGTENAAIRRTQPVPSGPPPGSGAVPRATQPADTASSAGRDSLGVEADSTASAAAGYVPSPEEIHRQIYLDFSRMDYKIALEESETFLSTYPEDPLAQDVRLIRGECFMELEQYFDALKEFSAILRDYPKGKKAAPALLRMAISYEKIGDKDLAAGIVRRLVREYPGSDEAAEARERFSEMLEE